MTTRRRTLLWGWLLAVVAMLVFAAAGRWQLGRMHEKRAMLAAAEQALDRGRAQPLLLASDTARAQSYDWAQGQGTVGRATIWLDSQQHEGRVGVRMYCLLLPDPGGQAMLVDAGWWPLQGDRTLPVFGCPAGAAQQVRGLLVRPPSTGLVRGDALADQGDGRWLASRIDLAAIASALRLPTGIAPRVLRLDPQRQASDAGVMLVPGERDLAILPNTMSPDRHLGYAVQWFALALATLAIALLLTFRKTR